MKLAKEIENLNQLVIKMADIVEENIQSAFSLLNVYDEEKASLINDDIVDMHERLVEEMCMSIMLKERPFASDMRKVIGILKLVEDIERLGDHAEDIQEFSEKLKDVKKVKIEKIERAIEFALKMVHDAVHSFVIEDEALAQQVILNDDVIDELYIEIIQDIIAMDENKKVSSSFAIYTILVVKYIERIADHACNIAEWVIYILVGYHKDKQIF